MGGRACGDRLFRFEPPLWPPSRERNRPRRRGLQQKSSMAVGGQREHLAQTWAQKVRCVSLTVLTDSAQPRSHFRPRPMPQVNSSVASPCSPCENPPSPALPPVNLRDLLSWSHTRALRAGRSRFRIRRGCVLLGGASGVGDVLGRIAWCRHFCVFLGPFHFEPLLWPLFAESATFGHPPKMARIVLRVSPRPGGRVQPALRSGIWNTERQTPPRVWTTATGRSLKRVTSEATEGLGALALRRAGPAYSLALR